MGKRQTVEDVKAECVEVVLRKARLIYNRGDGLPPTTGQGPVTRHIFTSSGFVRALQVGQIRAAELISVKAADPKDVVDDTLLAIPLAGAKRGPAGSANAEAGPIHGKPLAERHTVRDALRPKRGPVGSEVNA
jgi:hypothetical protein